MKKIILLIVLSLFLLVLIVGGTLIYNHLSVNYKKNDGFTVVNQSHDSDNKASQDSGKVSHLPDEIPDEASEETLDESFGAPEIEKTEEQLPEDNRVNISAPSGEEDNKTEKDKNTEQNSDEPEISANAAPDVEFYNSNGNSVMLSSFYNKPVVLNFWATWCGPCKSEMPGFNRLYEKYKDKVNFVMLNVSDSEKTVADFLDENGYNFPVYFDKTQIASYTYGASSIPLTFVLHKGGEVYGYQIGVLREEALEGVIKTVLGEE